MRQPGQFNQDGIIYVHSAEDVPSVPHFAALVSDTVMVPGYDQGDPSESANVISYIAFEAEDVLQKWLLETDASYSRKSYRIIKVIPAKVERRVTINVD